MGQDTWIPFCNLGQVTSPVGNLCSSPADWGGINFVLLPSWEEELNDTMASKCLRGL